MRLEISARLAAARLGPTAGDLQFLLPTLSLLARGCGLTPGISNTTAATRTLATCRSGHRRSRVVAALLAGTLPQGGGAILCQVANFGARPGFAGAINAQNLTLVLKLFACDVVVLHKQCGLRRLTVAPRLREAPCLVPGDPLYEVLLIGLPGRAANR